MSDGDGPFVRFCDDLDSLIDQWRDKPDDDQLSCAEIVGALEFVKLKIMAAAGGCSCDEE